MKTKCREIINKEFGSIILLSVYWLDYDDTWIYSYRCLEDERCLPEYKTSGDPCLYFLDKKKKKIVKALTAAVSNITLIEMIINIWYGFSVVIIF